MASETPPGSRPATAPGGVVGILHVIAGVDQGKAFPMGRAETTVGRGADQDCVLTDLSVSRRHCVIVVDGSGYRLRDLGSGNGSLVNSARVETHLLVDGDQIEIGNTRLQIEHAPSRTGATPAGGLPQQDSARTLIGDAPSLPSGPVHPPRPMAPSAMMPTTPPPRSVASRTRLIVGGAIVLTLAAASGFGVRWLLSRQAQQAEQLYFSGTQAFAAGDFAGAKKRFGEAEQLSPEVVTKAREYLRQCDLEIGLKKQLETARQRAAAKRWDEALQALAKIESSSAQFEEATKLRRSIIPPAVDAYLVQAREQLDENNLTAAAVPVEAALALDPDHPELQAIVKKLRASHVQVRNPREPRFALKEVRIGPNADEVAEAPRARGDDLLAVAGVAGPYRSRDFSAAARALKEAAGREKGKRAAELQAQAAQLVNLSALLARAEADQVRAPSSAIRAYGEALALDARLGHGMHDAYLKTQAVTIARDGAQESFAHQRWDVAYEYVKTIQRFGGEDRGIGEQLRKKAAQLIVKAASLLGPNMNDAKSLWRTVMTMVPADDPSYQKAHQALQSSTSARKDDDE